LSLTITIKERIELACVIKQMVELGCLGMRRKGP